MERQSHRSAPRPCRQRSIGVDERCYFWTTALDGVGLRFCVGEFPGRSFGADAVCMRWTKLPSVRSERDGGNLVQPFMRVANSITRHFATLRESQSFQLFTRACLNFITVTLRALGRTHIASTPVGANAMSFD